MSPALETLPELSSHYPLTEERIAAFQRDGHVLLRGVCSPEEIAVYGPVLNDAAYRYNTETRPMEERDTYAKAFLQVTNLWERDEAVRKYTLARRFAGIAAELLGVDGVRLYHDQALYKEPHGGLTPWHQDQYYWPLDTDNTVTMWMPLVDVSVEMGALTFATGSHKEGFLGHMQISDQSQAQYDALVKVKGYTVTRDAMKAGDATFHRGWTLHSAPDNASDNPREVMTIIYYADGTNIMPTPDNVNRLADLEAWFPGVKPGEPAVSRLNPLLYKK